MAGRVGTRNLRRGCRAHHPGSRGRPAVTGDRYRPLTAAAVLLVAAIAAVVS
jgi:hypothetical protein